FVYTPILPLMVEDLGMTRSAAGLLASANNAGYLAGALVAAMPGLPGSRRRWLLVALLVSALTTASMAVTSWSPAFLLLRFAGGVASAFGLVYSSALVLDRIGRGGRPGRSAVRFVGFGYIVAATFLVAIFRASPQVRALEAFVWLLVGLTAAPSVGVWTAVEGRVWISRSFALACVLEAVGVAASALWVRPTGILLAAALLGATFMGITALGLTWARRGAHGDPRSTLAVMTAAFGLGQIVGPGFAGMVYDATGTFVLASLAAAGPLL